MGRKSSYLWLACTNDELELPVFVEESCGQLAKKIGVGTSMIIQSAANEERTAKKYKIRKVNL